MVLPHCHSRAGGNPGFFAAELAWIPAFAGMTEQKRSVNTIERSVICAGFLKATRKAPKYRDLFLPHEENVLQ
jgi:hypothetical protein